MKLWKKKNEGEKEMRTKTKKIPILGGARKGKAEVKKTSNLTKKDYTSKVPKKQLKRSIIEIDERSRNWTIIVWSKEILDRVKQFFEENKEIKGAISPRHDPEKDDRNEHNKKQHWHIIFSFENKKSYKQMVEIVESIYGSTEIGAVPKKIGKMLGSAFKDLIQATRYLTHADHPFVKKTYEPREIKGFNGYAVEKLFTAPLVETNNDIQRNDIIRLIRNYDYTDLAEARDLVEDSYPYYLKTFDKNYGLIKAYLGGNFHRHQKKNAVTI